MNKRLKNLLGGVSMYRLMLYYLLATLSLAVILSLFGVLQFSATDILLQALVLTLTVNLCTQLLGKVFKVPVNPESSIITALILTLIVGPVSVTVNLWPLIFLGILAAASKFILNWKGRHIFNPAAAAVLASALLGGLQASWWVGIPYLLPAVLIGGILILRKIHYAHLSVTFLAAYLLGFALFSGIGNVPTLLLNSSLLFFALVMLIEPLTAPGTKRLRIGYGIFIALVLLALQEFLPDFPYGLETALLVGNLAFRIIAPPTRSTLILVGKERVAEETYLFKFDPRQPLNFKAGQFLEWTIAHPRSDSRGLRRYFTIASSPTEKHLMLTTKIGEQSSTFKKALIELEQGEEITATGPEGDFTLIVDKKRPLAFIAGGIGITPFRSMTKFLMDAGERRDIVLLYANRSPEYAAFRELFDEAVKTIGLKTIYEYSPIDEKILAEKIPDWRKRVFYVSGPEPMVEALEKTLADMGLPPAQIRRDYFPGYEKI